MLQFINTVALLDNLQLPRRNFQYCSVILYCREIIFLMLFVVLEHIGLVDAFLLTMNIPANTKQIADNIPTESGLGKHAYIVCV